MSYLLCLDESGHDHKHMPYEVRGGVAIHASRIWPFVQAMQAAELATFGLPLSSFRKEIKGYRLLDKDRYRWAAQGALLPDDDRRRLVTSFLEKGIASGKPAPKREEFTAYGQACIMMVQKIFTLLHEHGAVVFASMIPRGARPSLGEETTLLRKDHVFLLERFFFFGIQEPVRKEISDEFGPWLNRMQFHGDGCKDGKVYEQFGIVYIPDPYVSRT